MDQLDLALYDRPVRGPNKDLGYLVALKLSFGSLLLQELLLHEWNSIIIPDSITSLASASSFRSSCLLQLGLYIMPIDVHTPLPQYPSGVWRLLSRSRTNSDSCTILARYSMMSALYAIARSIKVIRGLYSIGLQCSTFACIFSGSFSKAFLYT